MSSFVTVIPYIQIVLSVLLVGFILLQRSDTGLGGAFGGDGFSSAKFERRGFEKLSFNITIVLAILFVILSIVTLFLS